ncbi:unnamed protein product [Amoebophrya sp. A120]|nr:unnamed protein product [Amoebophrya sp. A120]|eukprot:GSA120T00008925001.1
MRPGAVSTASSSYKEPRRPESGSRHNAEGELVKAGGYTSTGEAERATSRPDTCFRSTRTSCRRFTKLLLFTITTASWPLPIAAVYDDLNDLKAEIAEQMQNAPKSGKSQKATAFSELSDIAETISDFQKKREEVVIASEKALDKASHLFNDLLAESKQIKALEATNAAERKRVASSADHSKEILNHIG